MALRARTAASLAVLVTVLASPPAVAALPRTADAKPKQPHTPRRGVRLEPRSLGAARVEAGSGQGGEGSQVERDDNAVVRWEDQNGTVHYTIPSEVPQRFRPKLRRVYTTVGTVPIDRTEAPKSAAAREAPAALPVITLPPGPAVPLATDTPRPVSSGPPQGSTTGPVQPTSGGGSR
jgi:hypothetical protein